MSTFFTNSAPPKAEDHPANRAGSTGPESESKEQNSNFSTGQADTSADEPSTNPAAFHDSSKETAGNKSPETVPNEDSNKESVPNGGSQENAQEGEQSGSDDTDAEKKEADDHEYPSGWRLLLITIALCLCVFCTALVRCVSDRSPRKQPSLIQCLG